MLVFLGAQVSHPVSIFKFAYSGPVLVVSGLEKSSKFDRNIFRSYWRQTIITTL